jgi:hypothetical protein
MIGGTVERSYSPLRSDQGAGSRKTAAFGWLLLSGVATVYGEAAELLDRRDPGRGAVPARRAVTAA